MLLCDVSLGNIADFKDHKELDSTKFDSLLVQGRHRPSTGQTLKTWQGYEIPLGKIVPREKTSREWWCPEYSEYVVSSPDSVVVKYLVKLGNGLKKYSAKDLYLITDDEEKKF